MAAINGSQAASSWLGAGQPFARDCPRLFDQDDLNVGLRQLAGQRLQIPCLNSPTSTVTQSKHSTRICWCAVSVQSTSPTAVGTTMIWLGSPAAFVSLDIAAKQWAAGR